ncbi:MAG: glutamine-synthetase adenylyltransferase [Limimaricola sp.]|uniref:[protein-PII] uridylyltransferase family protein n=1 Tax=Limimaricola sp. TaxID=2211665 RepID=UPI001D5B04B4|nr:glutamine-synthetase adenylyltransferase [Limimaricola sp.]MBI1418346.1 glutamine-synthetase adenylyltransferase [Limimaricola sp.]
MSLAARLTRHPDPHDPDRGAAAWAALAGADAALRPLIEGAAGCSPYLAGLIAREGTWLVPAMADPEAALDAAIADIVAAEGDVGPVLRQAKRRVALLAALADLGGVWALEAVTSALTRLADAAVGAGLRSLYAAEAMRGRLPGMDPDDPTTGGIAVLAMGKMGAFELNYSSDIDLILLCDESRVPRDDFAEVRAGFVRVVRRLAALLSDQTADGYVFRTDLRLRPDPAVTPVIVAMEAAERYYESVGRTWERAAYIKARPCAGDTEAGARFLDTLRPFVWRRHLDFAAIQDAHDIRLKIRDAKGLHGLSLPGHDIKLGYGGIREIEFFTQTRQLIAGGRDPALRVRGTVEGLARLAAAGWVPPADAEALSGHYRFHREVEHRLQMIADAQTQSLPTTAEGFDRLAAFMGRSADGLRAELLERMEAVHALTEGFFAPGPARAAPPDDFGAEITARWRRYPALRSARAVEIFKRLRPEIMARLREAARPEEALRQFDGFLAGLPAGVQLFSLFEANPALTRLVVDICATAPALAQYLSRNAGVFDAVIGGDFFAPWPEPETLLAGLQAGLDEAAPDYEAQLNAARVWLKEWHFRVGVHHLRGLIDAATAGAQYAALADTVLAGLWGVVGAEFARKYGAPPGRGAALVAMGSLGAARLTAASDLDLILIYDADGVEGSDGPRPLQTRPYYARLTQALVTALTAPMSEGRLYEVDMRLRPSGKQGPVATSLQSFRDYQRNEAWTWEHLALSRARPVAGAESLMSEIEAFRCKILAEKAQGAGVLTDVAEMRARLAEARPGGAWDIKDGPGRLMDVDLLAQTAALRAGSPARDSASQIAAGVATGWLSDADAAALNAAIGLFWPLQAAVRLLTGGALDPDDLGEGGRHLVLRETGQPDLAALEREMAAVAARAAAVIDAALKRE